MTVHANARSSSDPHPGEIGKKDLPFNTCGNGPKIKQQIKEYLFKKIHKNSVTKAESQRYLNQDQLREAERPLQAAAARNSGLSLSQLPARGLSTFLTLPPATCYSGWVLGKCNGMLGAPFFYLTPISGFEALPWMWLIILRPQQPGETRQENLKLLSVPLPPKC